MQRLNRPVRVDELVSRYVERVLSQARDIKNESK